MKGTTQPAPEQIALAKKLFFEEELRPGEVGRQTGIAYPALIEALGFSTEEDMNQERRRILARQRYRTGWPKARDAARARDGAKCVITGSTDFEVHHIDGDRRNNALSNLVCLDRKIHQAVTSSRPGPETTAYLAWLRTHGFPDAGWTHCNAPRCHTNHLSLNPAQRISDESVLRGYAEARRRRESYAGWTFPSG